MMKVMNSVLLFFSLTFSVSYGQWNYDNQSMIYSDNAKVGVGTNSPDTKLHIYETAPFGDVAITLQNQSTWDPDATASLLFTHNANNFDGGKITSIREGNYLSGDSSTAHSALAFFTSKNGTNNEQMRITSAGKIGIGTNSPATKFHIFDTAQGEDVAVTIQNRSTWDPNATSSILFTHSAANFSGGRISSIREAYYRSNMISTANSSLVFLTSKEGVDSEHLRINSDGQVGIGTQNLGSHKLAVEGSLGAREVKVEVGAWSDFVFDKNYNLPSLKEVEEHIEKKGHLKDIPSAEEVKKDGISLGEMDAKLLQKIEELILYTIHQQKEIEKLKEELQKLKE